MKKTLLALALTVGLLLPAAIFADTAAWEWTTTGIEFTNGNWTFGQVFTPPRTSKSTSWATLIPLPGNSILARDAMSRDCV